MAKIASQTTSSLLPKEKAKSGNNNKGSQPPRRESGPTKDAQGTTYSQVAAKAKDSHGAKVKPKVKQAPRRRNRPDAILVKYKDAADYAKVLASVQTSKELQQYKENVRGVKRTAAGHSAKQDGSWIQNHRAGAAIWSMEAQHLNSETRACLEDSTRQPSFTSWSQETLDEGALLIMMDTIHIQASEDPDVYANNTALAIKSTCDASMLRKRKVGKCRKPSIGGTRTLLMLGGSVW
ncbi:hypothetical protein ACLKA6_002325 [Drosophila palustris]